MNRALRLLIVVILFTTSYANAQARPGIKLGVNSSNISKTRLDSNTGLYIGAFVKIPISEYYALHPELLYSNQGGKSNSTEYGDVNINYLSIGIPNKFYVGPNNGFHFMLGIGLDINLNNNFIGLSNFNLDGEISPIDVIALGGIGYEFNFGLTLEARYKQGTVSVDFLEPMTFTKSPAATLTVFFSSGPLINLNCN